MLLNALKDIPDPRGKQGRKFLIGEILFCSILAMVSGADSYRSIETFIQEKQAQMKTHFDLYLPKAPSDSTIRRIIISIDEKILENILKSNSSKYIESSEHIAIDGKTLRKSFDNFTKESAVHILNILAVKSLIVVAQRSVSEDKTNEIPIGQKVIKDLGLEGKMYTLDALHCQHETLRVVKASKSDCIVQVKNNQKKLLKLCQSVSNCWNPTGIDIQQKEGQRNRRERRLARVYENIDYLEERISYQWKGLIGMVIKIERTREELDVFTGKYKISKEDAYYVSTKKMTAKESNDLVRAHWSIENSLHYVKDVSMGEDSSRIRHKPENMSILRSIALNILRLSGKGTIKQKMFRFCCNTQALLNLDIFL